MRQRGAGKPALEDRTAAELVAVLARESLGLARLLAGAAPKCLLSTAC